MKFLLLYISFLFFIKITAQPIINSFTPSSGAIGTTVIITGTGFNILSSNNSVIFGATKATVTAASATSLTVLVPIGASFGPISVLNTVTGLATGSTRFYTPTFTPNSGNITTSDMAVKVDFTTGTNPYAVALVDIDGDGKLDLVVANYSTNSISVFQNTSISGSITPGSFAAKVDFNTGTNPYAIAIGDIDGDGKPDLVVTNNGSSTVSVFHNTSISGSITPSSLAAKVDFPTGTNPSSVAIADIDGDGKPDLVVANYNSNTVSVFQNTSTLGNISSGSFATKIDFTTGLLPNAVAIGDMDGDGKPDLVVANGRSYTVSVFRNTGISSSITSNSFATKVDFATATLPYSVAIGDLDGDGKLDIAVANESNNTVSVFRNTGSSGNITSGSFAAKVDFITGNLPFSVAIGDIDGDGKPDLVVANEDSANVSVFHNKCITGNITSNSFATKVNFKTGDGPYFVAIGDIDGDGKPDLVVANYNSNTVSVFHNTPIFPPTNLSYITPDIYTKGSVITPLYPTISGGAVTNYSVNPALPAGLNLDATTGVISGTPGVLGSATNYTVAATNIAGSTTAIINITVNDIAPGISYTTPDIYINGTSISPLVPVISGGAVINYSVSPVLPGGLSIDATTGVISGTPTVLSSAANYTVNATNSGGIGIAVLNIAVIKIPDPTITSNGSSIICEGSSLLLTSSEATGNQWYKNGVMIVGVGATAQSYLAKVAGTYTVIVSNSIGDVTNPSNAITVTINPMPVIKFSLPIVCLPDARAQFYDSSTIADNSQLSYYWNFGDGNDPSPSTLPNPVHIYSTGGPFSVQLKVTSINNCVDSLTKTVNTIYPQPLADFLFPKDSICVNDSIQFINQSNGNNVTKWFWDLASGNTSSLQNPAKKFIDSGSFNISMYFYNQQGCVSEKKIKPIVVSPYPVLNLNSNYFMLKGESLKIDSYYYYGTNLKFLWIPNTYLSNDTARYPVTQSPIDITYNLLLTGSSGCSVSQTTIVKVEKLDVPNAITPNGDGVNDTWEIPLLKNYQNCSVDVYNRNGQLVFRSIGYNKNWDGTYNNQSLPIGTYYYIIKTSPGANPLSGSVTIIR